MLSTPAPATSTVPLYESLGTLHRPVTASAAAQKYFDQGLRLTYAFNHEEAVRAFREAQRLDSSCTMCAWGEAIALGPNINAPRRSAAGVAALPTRCSYERSEDRSRTAKMRRQLVRTFSSSIPGGCLTST